MHMHICEVGLYACEHFIMILKNNSDLDFFIKKNRLWLRLKKISNMLFNKKKSLIVSGGLVLHLSLLPPCG